MTPPVVRIEKETCWRLIPSRFPPIALFERIASPEDFDALYEIEMLTNPRIRDEVGQISLIAPEDRIFGPGTSQIMAAFTHINPAGSRFSDGTYGVYYAAAELDTAVAETVYHRENFLRATGEAPLEIDMRALAADLMAMLHDIRNGGNDYPQVYHPADYSASRQLAIMLRKHDSDGIAYDSVRKAGGQCFAVFRPRCLSRIRQERHLCYAWDGQKISRIYEKKSYP